MNCKQFLMCGLFLVFGCSTTSFQVLVLKPSEINLGPVRKIAVLDFDFVGEWDFEIEEEEPPTTLQDILVKVIAKQAGVLPERQQMPHPRRAFPGKAVSLQFISEFVSNGFYKVVEREHLEKVLQEQKLIMSGAVDQNQAVKIGKLLGVDALVLGSGNYMVKNMGRWEEYEKKDSEGNTVQDASGNPVMALRYRAMRKVDVSLTYRIINSATGQIIASRSHRLSNCSGSGYRGHCQDQSVHKLKGTAIANLPPWRPVVDKFVRTIAANSVKQVAPHHVRQAHKIEKGKSPAMKAAVQYVKRQMWNEAGENWEKVLADRSEATIRDHVSALYNLGVYYEIMGDLDKAEANFSECFGKTGKGKYLDAKAMIKRRRKELRRLEEQMQQPEK